MAVVLAPVGSARPQFFTDQGAVLNGGTLEFYRAETSTPQHTYTDSTGDTENENPLELDADGRAPNGIWFTQGALYKIIAKDAAGVVLWTEDNVAGINDVTSTQDQWIASGLTATYVSATSFTVAGDQTVELHVGRRVKVVDAGGTKYGTIRTSVFSTLTTVVIDVDAGASLANPITSLSYGTLTATNPSIPAGFITPTQIGANQDNYAPTGYASAKTMRLSSDATRNVTGLAGGTDGRPLTIHNVGSFAIAFKYEDASSSAANRFAFACTLGGGQTMQIQYDGTSARWRAVLLPEPLGTIKDFAGTIPDGFLAVDQNVSRTTYASLFNYPGVGTTWGAGDGSTTFGLFVGAGHALIAAGTGTHTDSGVDADVSTGDDTLTVPSNSDKWVTGKLVTFSLASGTITGLTSGNPYYVIRATATTVKLASSLANAQNGTAIDLTAKSSPVWTITHALTARTLGQRLGAESHAMSSTEQLAHVHSMGDFYNSGGGATKIQSNSANTVIETPNTASTGGNAAMSVQNPSAVVTRGIRYV